MGTADYKETERLYASMSNIESLRELMSCPNSPLLTIAAMAERHFDHIAYFDEEIEEIDSCAGYDVVGMSFMTQQATRAYELAAKFRGEGVYTICGGMHPTNLPEQTLEYFDTVFIGECENTWDEFVMDFINGSPRRIYENTSPVDMKKAAIPRYDLLKIDRYKTIPVQISRGCPHNCAFCASTKVYGPQYRHKSIAQVMAELDLISALKPHPNIYFTDDNMLVQKEFAVNLLTSLKDKRINWMSHTDISVADHPEILALLHPSGCRKLVIGLESIVSESLESLEKWKHARMSQYRESIQKIQEAGVGVWGTFIVGLDHDNHEVFQKVVDFTLDNNLYGAMISVPTPFPGSALFDQLDKERRILSKHWGNYTLWNVVIKPKQMTVKELEDGFSFALKSIYSKEAALKRLEYYKRIYKRMGK
ncbi:MAG: B12-binding domain-containing radical SAM protein [Defluviitaleaceae bacterium]|nr:B12-binding domain-containing radical SAM protein [Defluviitaleaceae bacterium]